MLLSPLATPRRGGVCRLVFAVFAAVWIGLTPLVCSAAPASPDAERAVAQFREFFADSPDAPEMRDTNEHTPSPALALRFAAQLGTDGRWPDLDYASKARSSWPPAQHWERLKAMATIHARAGTAAADRATLLAAIHRAFAHWIARDYQCTNWWYNEIGIPKLVGPTLLLLGDAATPDELRYGTEVSLARYPTARTGQNKIWLAGNALMRGLLLRDDALITAATDAIWSEIEITTAEGLQPDFSFHQHGAQQQFGNYGLAYAVNMGLWARILRGTRWQLPPEKLAALRGYLVDGQAWISWRGAMDISACGRQFMPNSPRGKTRTIARVMRQALLFDPAHAAAYEAFVARNETDAPNTLVGFRHFWRSDYAVFRRPEFMATLKFSSHRVIGAELVNSENLSGFYSADGALYLYRRGDEYQDIFPLWNWSRLPGITAVQTPPPVYKESQVPTDFAGGLSDGAEGLAALDYRRVGVAARKAWFFTADSVVALGAGVSGTADAPIATTVNQAHLRGAVRVRSAAGTEDITRGNRTLPGEVVVEHDGWRYTLASDAPVRLEAGPVTGHWKKVYTNPSTPPADVTAPLFALGFDHGVRPNGGRYAYTASLAASPASIDPRVLANTDTVQAVAFASGKVALVFWQAGDFTLPDGARLTASAPCLVLIDGLTARVVDPTQKLRALTLSRNDITRPVTLPTGGAAGTPAVVDWR
jgi:chondroitin AC lyase